MHEKLQAFQMAVLQLPAVANIRNFAYSIDTVPAIASSCSMASGGGSQKITSR